MPEKMPAAAIGVQPSSRVVRCAQCGDPLKTIPGKPALPNMPILCKECFGAGTYERRGRSWLDLLYAPAIAEGGEVEL
ncbi:MAG: hypothetical protein AUJ92_13830 [Armatimonadetes bacterium CG2_30_59_28]|nr:MAG: hypothetical protein AUJ92_13830 [Armatimonadetes bacterium CG2_30_59_28]PIU64711.1 MAG: hypothetical protein COS85_11530 [Armatimonadetes bacterium CG07_land_8_20_14_0_80_59_28]PIX45543.1 MAG: hypothetical protein COZ56_01635 [Armatimonadetes bacterium CG_4_8_14_3_um_filter_58_9]PIY48537.1 MAG: hypothetical protein COZ05_02860 [Armatimonadetes bacterium CG_4_10_14_3_um_filter_59_10]